MIECVACGRDSQIKHFNKLSPEQHELLTKIFEESSEVVQAIAKIMLHGLWSTDPAGIVNKERLEDEIGELLAFIKLACDKGLLSYACIKQACEERFQRREHFLHHVVV